MARIHFDPDLSARIKRGLPPDAIGELPLDLVKNRLRDVQRQRLIPFLGAGTSLPPGGEVRTKPTIKKPSHPELDSMFRGYNIDHPLQFAFLEAALVVAQLLKPRPADPINLTQA